MKRTDLGLEDLGEVRRKGDFKGGIAVSDEKGEDRFQIRPGIFGAFFDIQFAFFKRIEL